MRGGIVRGSSQSKNGVYVILCGVVCLVIGLIIYTTGMAAFISANKEAINALEDNNMRDYYEASREAMDAYELQLVGFVIDTTGLILAFLGIAMMFLANLQPSVPPTQTVKTSQGPIQQQPPPGMKFCVHCGYSMPIGSPFCPNCQRTQG